jgi:hypothetical protein
VDQAGISARTIQAIPQKIMVSTFARNFVKECRAGATFNHGSIDRVLSRRSNRCGPERDSTRMGG